MADLGELIEAHLDALEGREWIAAHEAKLLDDLLRTEHPEALRAYLDSRARHILRDELVRRSSQRRRIAHSTQVQISDFERMLRAIGDANEAGEQPVYRSSRFDPFLVHHVVDEGNRRKPVGRMKNQDWLFVSNHRSRAGRKLLLEGAFAQVMARHVPDDGSETDEVMTREEFLALRQQVLGSAEGGAAEAS